MPDPATRADGRTPDQLRPVTITRGWLDHAEGSVLVEFGRTRVLCAASFTAGVPRWRKGSGEGWVTAEYAMLPRATNTRSDRESVKGRIGGRTHEICRLVGRSLRAIVDYRALGENTIVLDCDVLQADGGTRTAAITGAYVALADAVAWATGEGLVKAGAKPLTGSVAAVSVGVVDGLPLLDLAYAEDVRAETDMNVVTTGDGQFVEVQGTAEGAPFDRPLLDSLLDLAVAGCARAHRAAGGRAQPSGRRSMTGPTRPRLVLATRNPHKVVELDRILDDAALDVELVGVDELRGRPRRRRDRRDLRRERAAQGARGRGGDRPARRRRRLRAVPSTRWAGMPGVLSARWSGRHGDDAGEPAPGAGPARGRARRAPGRRVRLLPRRSPSRTAPSTSPRAAGRGG